VLEAKQRIGRIPLRHRAHAGRLVVGRHRPPECRPPDGLSQRPAKAEFRVAWEALKAGTTPEQLAAAYRAMNSTSGRFRQ
jgi:hypothetical protein